MDVRDVRLKFLVAISGRGGRPRANTEGPSPYTRTMHLHPYIYILHTYKDYTISILLFLYIYILMLLLVVLLLLLLSTSPSRSSAGSYMTAVLHAVLLGHTTSKDSLVLQAQTSSAPQDPKSNTWAVVAGLRDPGSGRAPVNQNLI